MTTLPAIIPQHDGAPSSADVRRAADDL